MKNEKHVLEGFVFCVIVATNDKVLYEALHVFPAKPVPLKVGLHSTYPWSLAPAAYL